MEDKCSSDAQLHSKKDLLKMSHSFMPNVTLFLSCWNKLLVCVFVCRRSHWRRISVNKWTQTNTYSMMILPTWPTWMKLPSCVSWGIVTRTHTFTWVTKAMKAFNFRSYLYILIVITPQKNYKKPVKLFDDLRCRPYVTIDM